MVITYVVVTNSARIIWPVWLPIESNLKRGTKREVVCCQAFSLFHAGMISSVSQHGTPSLTTTLTIVFPR